MPNYKERMQTFFDLIVVNDSWEDTYTKIMNALDDVENEASWVPAKWVYS